ncbi:hypothetical protein M0R45_020708 [Rubus argutus]|uniref:Uncharacterized protein n=1 Tax=Rubus argutus TaxID=59490 RepID=A0AAW1X979_RUBAR
MFRRFLTTSLSRTNPSFPSQPKTYSPPNSPIPSPQRAPLQTLTSHCPPQPRDSSRKCPTPGGPAPFRYPPSTKPTAPSFSELSRRLWAPPSAPSRSGPPQAP